MPWKVSQPVDERMDFIRRWQQGERVSDLCRQYDVSRKTAYKFIARYRESGPVGLFDVSRRPERLARTVPPEIVERVLATRRAHPTWGSPKLRAWLAHHEPGVRLPACSTITQILHRNGLITERRRRPRVPAYDAGLERAENPNDIWCADYKGHFRLGNGQYCYPLTVSDQFSRYLLGCEGFSRIDGRVAQAVFERLFERFGVPRFIRTDNGAPFASRGLWGLTRLSVFWLKHGIRHERIKPSHPEQNGRHERMHRTLKQETTRPPARTLLSQQERFDHFVSVFNELRPHEALGQKTPASAHTLSSRPWKPAGELTYPLHDDVRRVKSCGHLHILQRRGTPHYFVSTALAGERVGIREIENDCWLVTFGALDLGIVDTRARTFTPAYAAPTIS